MLYEEVKIGATYVCSSHKLQIFLSFYNLRFFEVYSSLNCYGLFLQQFKLRICFFREYLQVSKLLNPKKNKSWLNKLKLCIPTTNYTTKA